MKPGNSAESARQKFILSFSFRDSRGKEIVSHRSHLPVLPASNQKILTGYAAYSLLGKGYRLRTEFTASCDGLVISGGPTPILFSSDLSGIIAQFDTHTGSIKFSDMDVEFTSPMIDDIDYNPNWTYGDSSYSYQSPITNFSINENCQPRSNRSYGFSPDDLHAKEDNFTPVSAPEKYFSDIIRKSMKGDSNSGHKGKSEFHNDTYVHEESLLDIIRHMEKVSCNYSAEVLFKLISAQKGRKLGNWNDSIHIVSQFISRFIGRKYLLSIVDGSGLSRENFVTTGMMSQFISAISSSGDSRFLDYLPSPGNGTLKNRLIDFKPYRIHAKTGSLNGVSSLSGHIESSDTSFSIILNNYLGHTKPSEIVDAVLKSYIDVNDVPLSIEVGGSKIRLD